MTARQPQSMNEAIMLGQMMPNQPRGIFGGMRRRPGLLGGGNFASPYGAPQVDAPPPITAAPPPPADWADRLGPETLGNLPQIAPYPPLTAGMVHRQANLRAPRRHARQRTH